MLSRRFQKTPLMRSPSTLPLVQAVAIRNSLPTHISHCWFHRKSPFDGNVKPLANRESPTATPSCSTKYTIKAGDTYLGVSKSQHVATHDLVTANRLDYRLNNFPSSGDLCIRNQCDVYVVKEGDTCLSIQLANDITRATLRSWNPFINGYCDNISSYINQTICVSNSLGDYKVLENKDSAGFSTPAAVPSNVAPDTNIECGLFHNVTADDNCGTIGLKYRIPLNDLIFLNPMVYQNCTNLWLWISYCVAPVGDLVNYPGYLHDEKEWTIEPQETTQVLMWDMFLGDSPYIPIANGTREDCRQYFWWNETLAGSPIDCLSAAKGYEIDMEQFLLWNPSLDQNWTETDKYWPPDNYPCTISADVSYCMQLASPTPMPYKVAPPSPRAAGEIANCTRWFVAYFSCQSQLGFVRMSMERMYRYNPSLKEDCSGYTLGTYYCHETINDLLYGYGNDPEPTSSQIAPSISRTSSDTA
ncbi:carbohydrate-binding module family 50 [Fusarium sporotrichioides]|uniref:Carbohydrate-binding module family 50 n=1 Tax=Fusarium sporotrichioides TaxID=5514 RepID=A0A395RUZ3_FUSSP|nr:carbohydrate-binding module family 50 [Fusarium sporotrichioides]